MNTSHVFDLNEPDTPESVFSDRLTRGLVRARNVLVEQGLPSPELRGQLLRPAVAMAFLPRQGREAPLEFWMGALAIQMVHEASLHHDDVLDDGKERRGAATLHACRGAGAALLEGDRLLTGGYRAAFAVGQPDFMGLFAEAVERTVAGEGLQAKLTGQVLDHTTHAEIIALKSGQLFGCAAALAGGFGAQASRPELMALGTEMGSLYQMYDDFLDYCPEAATGKQALQDLRCRKWTWVLDGLPENPFDCTVSHLLRVLFDRGPSGSSPMDGRLACMKKKAAALRARFARTVDDPRDLDRMVTGWMDRATQSLESEIAARRSLVLLTASTANRTDEPVRDMAIALGGEADWPTLFQRHSRSFSFASKLFTADFRRTVTAVYVFCRFTDDLVDEANHLSQNAKELRLAEWERLLVDSFDGHDTGVPILDTVTRDMERSGVPLYYATELIEGVRMDLTERSFASLREVETYSFRVASVVGGWITRLAGVDDPGVLEGAYALGHAMQLTNILRDVGEDLEMGRLYLPRDLMAEHGVTPEALKEMAQGSSITPEYRALLEDLMAHADGHYAHAFTAMLSLPRRMRRAVAAAAEIYRGIHNKIRNSGYNNLSSRATTSRRGKVVLAARGWVRLLSTSVGRTALGTRARASLKPNPQ